MSKQMNELQKLELMMSKEEPVYYGHTLKSKMITEKSPVLYPQKKIGYDFKNGSFVV